MLDSALKAAERCADPNDREAISKVVSDVRSMVDALNELKESGQVCIYTYTHRYIVCRGGVRSVSLL